MSTIEAISQLIPAGTWKADPSHSHVEFGVKHLKIVTVKGRFGAVEGTLDGGEEPSLTGIIHTASVNTYDENRDAHLRSPEFFDSERYPEARIESVRLGESSVSAELTLRGVTRQIELAAEYAGPTEDPFGNTRFGINLEGEIDRTEFGLAWNAPLPGGGFLVDDIVTLTASLSFVREA